MKRTRHPALPHPDSLRALLGVALLLGVWQLAAAGAGWAALTGRLDSGMLLVLAIAILLGALCRRVRSEDRVVRLEADLCRERGARSRADDALAEADLLLARISGRAPGRAAGQHQDPAGQLGLVQAELMLMQSGAADPDDAARIEMLRTRLELVARAVRQAPGAADAV